MSSLRRVSWQDSLKLRCMSFGRTPQCPVIHLLTSKAYGKAWCWGTWHACRTGNPAASAGNKAETVMDFATQGSQVAAESENGSEQRAAPRFSLLIRAAKLVCKAGEFVCVIRDVSESGVSVRLFHALPAEHSFALHMPAGAVYDIARVWERGYEAGFRFAGSVAVETLINEPASYPKRGLRLAIAFPVTVSTLAQRCPAKVANLSQQGALLECEGLFAIDQTLRIAAPAIAPEFKEIRAKVRWRRGTHYGVVFDDTFTLAGFARLAAHLQAPALVAEEPR